MTIKPTTSPGTLPESLWTQNMTLVLTPEQVVQNLERFEKLYPELFAILNVLGLSSAPFKSPFTEEMSKESFQNAREQIGMVALIAEKIADAFLKAWIINDRERKEIMHAAILHNSLKRLEALWKTEIKGIPMYSQAWYEIVWAAADTLVQEADKGLALAMRNLIWHGSLRRFVNMKDGQIVLDHKRRLTEMIVHIASDMVWAKNLKEDHYTPNIQISSFVERARYANFPRWYSKLLYTEGLAVGANESRELGDINKPDLREGEVASSYYELQAHVYEMICTYLQQKIDPKSTVDPIEFIVWIATKGSSTDQIYAVTNAVQKVWNF